jgi:hypothetical protein
MNRDGVELFGSTCLVDWAALPWRPHPGTRLAFGGQRPSVLVDQVCSLCMLHLRVAIDMDRDQQQKFRKQDQDRGARAWCHCGRGQSVEASGFLLVRSIYSFYLSEVRPRRVTVPFCLPGSCRVRSGHLKRRMSTDAVTVTASRAVQTGVVFIVRYIFRARTDSLG